MVAPEQTLALSYNQDTAAKLLAASDKAAAQAPTSLVVIYSYGDFRAASQAVRSDDPAAKPIEIRRDDCVPANRVNAFFSNPFGNLEAARTAPLKIENALITPVPSASHGWIVAIALFVFMAFYAVGPGVCVWLRAFGIDANPHPFEWHEHRTGAQSGCLHGDCSDLLTHGRRAWIFDDVLRICRLHGDLLHYRNVVPARDQGKNAGRD